MIQIPVTPWVKKFADHRLGHPITFAGKSCAHILLKSLLFQAQQTDLFEQTNNHRTLPCTIQIIPPRGYRPVPSMRRRLPIITKYLQTLFLEEMKTFVDTHNIIINRRPGPHNIQYQLAAFCQRYGIEIEQDITQDALLKMYQRYCNWLRQNSPIPPNGSIGNLQHAALC